MEPRTTPPTASSSTSTRRSPARTAAAALALFALAGVAAAMSSAGCSSAPAAAPPFCEGGFIRKQPTASSAGVCEGKCSAAACDSAAGIADAGAGPRSNTCVDNHCALQCASLQDCAPLSQDCVAAKEDGTSAAINVCQDNGKGAIGTACPFGTECKTQFACPDGKGCDPTCSGSSCACAAADCKALVCLTVGAADADAYCTIEDCHQDSDCPGGFWCESARDPHQVCNSTVGTSPLCGAKTPCVDPSMDMATGTTYAVGTACALRNQCRRRGVCTTCADDIDCSSTPGLHCTMMPKDGTKACTRDCKTTDDCEDSFECTAGACVPRYGSCVGTGKFCEPCRTDLECGGTGSSLVCLSFGGDERMCVDTAGMCAADTDCAKTPAGVSGLCDGNSMDPVLYQKCLPPQNSGSGALSCWCSNPGKACYLGAECCSKKCVGADSVNMIPGTCK